MDHRSLRRSGALRPRSALARSHRATILATVLAIAAPLWQPAAASAHGLVGRADLPIPVRLFALGATLVLLFSFLALAVLWRSPQLEDRAGRALLRVPAWLEAACGAIGVALFAGLVYAGFAGTQVPTDNVLPTFVYVVFWVGLALASAVLGDIFRAFSPWRAVGRAVGHIARARGGAWSRHRRRYPGWLGRWPAVVGLVVFGWLELVAPRGDEPAVLAAVALAYAGVQLAGMAICGVSEWHARGDAFGVYFGMFAALAPITVRDGHVVLRRPLSGLAAVRWLPGTVPFVAATIGITAFDGASEGTAWNRLAVPLYGDLLDAGLARDTALQATFALGLVAFVALVAAFYRLGTAGMRWTVRRVAGTHPARAFVHSLVPIALAYVLAHYFSFLVFPGQAMARLASDPLGHGADLLGTAGARVDYAAVSPNAIWYVQLAALVIGHAVALAVAHDRAVVLLGDTREAVRSQYWMLGVMVGFTTLGLWLLSSANR